MTEVTYKREGKTINPEPISIEIIEPHIKFDPTALQEIIADHLVEITMRGDISTT